MTNKMLIVTGPTGSGKTSLAVRLAQKFNGEIISADSRQVYRGMDIGTGKDKEEYLENGIRVWGIDLVDPNYNFNVSDFVKFATASIYQIQNRNRLPIVVGGTALYIKALLDPIKTINVPPNEQLRNELAKYSVIDLQEELKKLDKNKWEKLNQSDKQNPRRLLRTIEVAKFVIASAQNAKGNFPSVHPSSSTPRNDILLISLSASNDFLFNRIDQRVEERIKNGAIGEVQKLLKMGYSFNLPSMSASGYKEFKQYFLSLNPSLLAAGVQKWKQNEHSYSKRQNTFIKKLVAKQVANGLLVRQANIEVSSWKEEIFKEVGKWCIMDANDPKKT